MGWVCWGVLICSGRMQGRRARIHMYTYVRHACVAPGSVDGAGSLGVRVRRRRRVEPQRPPAAWPAVPVCPGMCGGPSLPSHGPPGPPPCHPQTPAAALPCRPHSHTHHAPHHRHACTHTTPHHICTHTPRHHHHHHVRTNTHSHQSNPPTNQPTNQPVSTSSLHSRDTSAMRRAASCSWLSGPASCTVNLICSCRTAGWGGVKVGWVAVWWR